MSKLKRGKNSINYIDAGVRVQSFFSCPLTGKRKTIFLVVYSITPTDLNWAPSDSDLILIKINFL
jgi:hypothetical protein